MPQQIARQFAGAGVDSPQHPAQLIQPLAFGQFIELGHRASLDHFFLHAKMPVPGGGHLGQMGDAQHLVGCGEFAQPLPDGHSGFPTHVGIDFVKNQNRDLVLFREHRLQRQHHTGHLPTGGNRPEWAGGFARVGGKLEFDRVGSARRGRSAGRQFNSEIRLLEPQ